jgi:hypothetical protein
MQGRRGRRGEGEPPKNTIELDGYSDGCYKSKMNQKTNFYTAVETSFMGMVSKPLKESTARAAARDLQKALLRSRIAADGVKLSEKFHTTVNQVLETAVENGKISKTKQHDAVIAVQKAVARALSSGSDGTVKADILQQIQAADISFTSEATHTVSAGVTQALCDEVADSEIDSFVSEFLDQPTNAVRQVLEHKKRNFITRGVSEQEIETSIKKELSEELRRAIKKSRA